MAHWGKRTLAYPIKKKEVGYYVVAHVETDTELLSEFERIVKLNESVLRYLVVINEGLPATRPDQTESESPTAQAAGSGDARKEGAEDPVVEEAPAQAADEAPEAKVEEGQQLASTDETPATEVEEEKQPASTEKTPEAEVEEKKQTASTDEGGE